MPEKQEYIYGASSEKLSQRAGKEFLDLIVFQIDQLINTQQKPAGLSNGFQFL